MHHGNIKKSYWKQVLFSSHFHHLIPHFHPNNAISMTAQPFPMHLIPMKHTYESSISNRNMFVCIIYLLLTFSSFFSHFDIHHWYTSSLFYAAILWLLNVPCVYIIYQALGFLEALSGRLFNITVCSSLWYAWLNMVIMSLFHCSSQQQRYHIVNQVQVSACYALIVFWTPVRLSVREKLRTFTCEELAE